MSIWVHTLQVGDICRWKEPSRCHSMSPFKVTRITSNDDVWYEYLDSGDRFYNNGIQDIVLIRESSVMGVKS